MIGDPKTVGVRMRQAAEEAGLTRKRIAELLGLHTNTICQWQNGYKLPGAENMRRYAAITRKPEEWFCEPGETRDGNGLQPCPEPDPSDDNEEPEVAANDNLPWLAPEPDGSGGGNDADRMLRELIPTAALAWSVLNEQERRNVLHKIVRQALLKVRA